MDAAPGFTAHGEAHAARTHARMLRAVKTTVQPRTAMHAARPAKAFTDSLDAVASWLPPTCLAFHRYDAPEHAYDLPDISESWFLRRVATCDSPIFWQRCVNYP